MSDDGAPLLTPLDLGAQPGRPAWGLLVFELVQIALTVAYFATGLWFRVPGGIAILLYCAGVLAAVIALIWAIVELRQTKRKGIPRLVTTLASITVALYVLSLVFLAFITAQLTV